MTRYLLDTNHCSMILKGNPDVIQRLNQYREAEVTTSVIVCGELFFMAYKSEQSERNLFLVENLLSHLSIYAIDGKVAGWYGNLKAALLRRFGPKEKSR
jgi:tRNA(fMet)-specific endonuclease VapC